MSRRDFLLFLPTAGAASFVGASGLLACSAQANSTGAGSPRTERAPRAKIRAICFDLFTLFDPRSVVDVARTVFGDQAAPLCEAWRARQFEYSWLRVATRQYADFDTVTDEALRFAAKTKGLALPEEARHTLVDAYSRLTPWPDARDTLQAFQRAGIRLAPLSNYSPPMLARLLSNAGLSELFAEQISTDPARTFKPDPRAYALAESRFKLKREQIAFAAFGGWDAAGAKWFGFPTFWVNRLGVPQEELIPPDGTGPTLAELARFVSSLSDTQA
jgi:2-haloacid dehalogenase